MKGKKLLIPLIIVAVLVLVAGFFFMNSSGGISLFTSEKEKMALETIRSNIIGYVFAGETDSEYSKYRYVFTFTDEDTVTVEESSWNKVGDPNRQYLVQDFAYTITVEDDEFILNVGKPKNEINSIFKVARFTFCVGTFVLTDHSVTDEGCYKSILGIGMNDGKTIPEAHLYLDLTHPVIGSKMIKLPSDIE